MKPENNAIVNPALNRRDFIKGSSFATLMTMLGGIELRSAEPAPGPKAAGPKVKCGVVGLGPWGREIIATLQKLPVGDVAGICDTYPAMLRRGANAAPGAVSTEDYRKLLDDKEIKAIIVATPTHQHKDIALAALQAGKHVYCEAPLALTIEDARTIALAARKHNKLVFQPGLQLRSDPQRHFLLQFIRAGAMGKSVMARAQWHKKTSWRFPSPNPERETEINWRLRKESSLGLAGEIGIHQLDMVSWFLNGKAAAITGFGSITNWQDGREVADTIQAVVEYAGGVNLTYDCTLANSFDADYEMYYGTDAAIMVRGNKAWMFKEVDSPLLGWEVYARKDAFYKETGIALVANATKLAAQGDKPVEDAPYTNTPLFYALDAFLNNVNDVSTGVEDFLAGFENADEKALAAYLADLELMPAATYKDGFEATVLAIKTEEAIRAGKRLQLNADMFKLA